MKNENCRYDNLGPTVETRVDDLRARMTLADKIGQLVMPDPDEMQQQIEQAKATGQPLQFAWRLRPGLAGLEGRFEVV